MKINEQKFNPKKPLDMPPDPVQFHAMTTPAAPAAPLHTSKFRSKETAAILRAAYRLPLTQDAAAQWQQFTEHAAADLAPFLDPSNDRERNTLAVAERETRAGIMVFVDRWFPAAAGIRSMLDADTAGCRADYHEAKKTAEIHLGAIRDLARLA